jgi:hypothetical protein
MSDTKWTIEGKEFINCNCSYGCPCQFNGLPTHGFCEAVGGFKIDRGFHGKTKLDGLNFVGIFHWPGPIHEGKGEAAVVIDESASPEQREALLRIITGQDTEPGATIFNVFAATLEKLHPPIFAPVDFEVDVQKRKAKLVVQGVTEGRGEPIVNPVTGEEHRVRIDLEKGFEYSVAEIGRGWSNATSPMKVNLSDSYGQFASIHMTQSGIVK